MTDDLILLNADWFNSCTGESHALSGTLFREIHQKCDTATELDLFNAKEWAVDVMKNKFDEGIVCFFFRFVVAFLSFILAALRFRVHVKVWIIKIELFCGSFGFWLVYLTNAEGECRVHSLFAVCTVWMRSLSEQQQHNIDCHFSIHANDSETKMINTIHTLEL